MVDLNLSQTGEGMLALVIVAIMFALFLTERWPTEVVAIAGRPDAGPGPSAL
jgi:hypothetical protein